MQLQPVGPGTQAESLSRLRPGAGRACEPQGLRGEAGAVGQVLVPRAASSLVAAGPKPQAGLPEREGVWAGGALIALSRRPPWWLGCGSQAPPPTHPFRAGCQGFHSVTQILPIQGNSCPLTQLLADSTQVKWSTAEAHAAYRVSWPSWASNSSEAQPASTGGHAKCLVRVHRKEEGRLGTWFQVSQGKNGGAGIRT